MSSAAKSASKTTEPARGKANRTSPRRKNTQPMKTNWDLNAPELFLNRELTYLKFNQRVLHEAEDHRTKLLERVKFVAIVCSNLDEFFMKRIGGLKQQVGAGFADATVDGRSPDQQIVECHEEIRKIELRKSQLFREVIGDLKQENIHLLAYSELSSADRKYLRDFFYDNIFPLITPQGIDPAHPFPFISNLSLNLLVALRADQQEEVSLARVKIPIGAYVPRFVQIGENHRFVRLEEIMSHNLDLLFPGMEILSCELFRVTRNAVTELDEDQAEDLLAMIETELRYRKFAAVVRLQVTPDMTPAHRARLASELGLNEASDVFEVSGMMGKSDLMELTSLPLPHLHDPPFHPIDHPRLKDNRPIFYKLRDYGPMLLFHPYESFPTSVERFLQEASEDPKVRAIKMTLYRTSKKSKVIRYLVNAARNGKHVTVAVELKARFDEAANIQWAARLEEAGIHVTYGVIGFKTHSKVILVVRRDYDGLRRYAHIGTGNYHAGTARLYTDMGLLTCDDTIGQDLTEFFNYLTTGFTPKRKYRKLMVAPSGMKKAIIEKIDREIDLHHQDGNGQITFKMNALEDPDITRALYRAGQAGVPVNLIVRDTCRLRAGIPGLSDSIRVISIVGRFLEHARIYYFHNGGKEEYFLGSADFMKRNLESRVEVLVPVEEPVLRRELAKIFSIQWEDRRSAWEMDADGEYHQRKPKQAVEDQGSQQRLIQIAEKRQKAAANKRLKSGGKSKKEFWASH